MRSETTSPGQICSLVSQLRVYSKGLGQSSGNAHTDLNMSFSIQPPRSIRSTQFRSPTTIPASAPITPPNVTVTYQIGSLKSHRGCRNLTTKSPARNKRTAVYEHEDVNPTKKRKAQERVHPASVPSLTAQAVPKEPQTPMNQGSSEPLVTQKGSGIHFNSRMPARNHGSISEVPVDLSWQPRTTANLMPLAPEATTQKGQSETSIALAGHRCHSPSRMPPSIPRLHAATPVESRYKPAQQWSSLLPLTLASSDSYRVSRMLPSLTGLDPALLVDFSRQYGPERDHPRICAHPERIEARFSFKPRHPLASTWNQLPGSASTLEPSRFYSPVKCGFENSLRLAPLLLPEGSYFDRPWISLEEKRIMSHTQPPKYAAVGLNSKSAPTSQSPNYSVCSSQSPSQTNIITPENSDELLTPGSIRGSNLRKILLSNHLSQQYRVVVDTTSGAPHSGNHSYQGLDRNHLFNRERATLDYSPLKVSVFR